MSDNLEIGRLEQNLGTAAVNTVDTALSRIDGRFSAPLAIEVGSDNAHTISQNDLRRVSHIVLSEGSPATSGAVTITINPADTDQSPAVARNMGGFFVINKTANTATITIAGQSNTAPTVAANSGGEVHVTSTGVWGVSGSGGGATAADDVTFTDPTAGSPSLDNVQEALDYLLANPFGGGGGGGGAVDSVFSRTGAVVAEAGDYTAAQVTYTDKLAGSPSLDNVEEALDYAIDVARSGGGGGGGSSGGISGSVVACITSEPIADDAAVSYAVGEHNGILLQVIANGVLHGVFLINTATGDLYIEKVGGGAGFAVVSGPVSGTTGTDNSVNIGRDVGAISIENRAGSLRRFVATIAYNTDRV